MDNINSTIVNAQLKEFYPDTITFIENLRPFFIPVKEDYQKFEKVLHKLGIESIEKYVTILLSMLNGLENTLPDFLNKIIKELEKRYGYKIYEMSLAKLFKEVGRMTSFDSTFSDFAKLVGNSNGLKKIDDVDKEAAQLSEKEQAYYQSFSLLIVKVWVKFMITNPNYPHPIIMQFVKEQAQKYYTRINEFYDKEIIPSKLIEYIKGIEIPEWEEDEIIEEIKATTVFNMTVPNINKIEKIFEVLNKHFDVSQHGLLYQVLQGKTEATKLIYKGNGNQLADVFKRLIEANVITSCNKLELTQWIILHFEYKSHKTGRGISYKEKYLHDLISSNTKPCKNPLIEIRKDNRGEVTIFPLDRKGRNQL